MKYIKLVNLHYRCVSFSTSPMVVGTAKSGVFLICVNSTTFRRHVPLSKFASHHPFRLDTHHHVMWASLRCGRGVGLMDTVTNIEDVGHYKQEFLN